MRALLPMLLLLAPCRSQLSHELTKLQRQGVQTPHILFMVPEAPHPAEGGPDGSEEVASSEERRPDQDAVFVPFSEAGPGLVRFEPRPNHEEAHPLPEHGPPFVQEAPNIHGPVIHQGQYLRPPHRAIHPHQGVQGQPVPDDAHHFHPSPREHSEEHQHTRVVSRPDPPLDRQPGLPPNVYQLPPQLNGGPGIGPHIIIQGPAEPNVFRPGSQPVFVPSGPPHGQDPRVRRPPPQDFVILRIFNDSSQPQLINENPESLAENPKPENQTMREGSREGSTEEPRLVLPVAEIAESADIVGSLSEDGEKGQGSGGEGQQSMTSSSSESLEETESSKKASPKPKNPLLPAETFPELPGKNVTLVAEVPPDSLTSPTPPPTDAKKEPVIVFMSNGPLTPAAETTEQVSQASTQQPSTTTPREEVSPTTTPSTVPALNPESGSPSELEPVVIVWSEPPSDPSTTTTNKPTPFTGTIEISLNLSESSVHEAAGTSDGKSSLTQSLPSTEQPSTSAATSASTPTTTTSTTTTEMTQTSTEAAPYTQAAPPATPSPEQRVTTNNAEIGVTPESTAIPTTMSTTTSTTTTVPSGTAVVELASSSLSVRTSEPTSATSTTIASSGTTKIPESTTTASSSAVGSSTAAPVTATSTVTHPTTAAVTALPSVTVPSSTTEEAMASPSSTTETPSTTTTTTTSVTELSSEPFDFATERGDISSTASSSSVSPSPAYVPTESAVAESNASEVTANEISNETANLPETTIVFAKDVSVRTDAPSSQGVTQRPQRPTATPSPSPSPPPPPPAPASLAPATASPPKYYELPSDKEKPSIFPTQTVRTRNGQMKGNVIKTSNGVRVNSFLGIPYAQKPVGSLRFERPIEFPPWTGVFEAKKLPKSCPQPTMQLNGFVGVNISDTSEDCLYLNIWSPFCDGAKKCRSRPVIVYIHGGGFLHGGVNWPIFDGAELSARAEVVVVSLNYRLGALGFLYVPSNGGRPERANMGLYDQHLALRWVKSNIKAFGGDHNKITIMGQDAGSASVGYHILTPRSTGLFKRAVMQSGSPFSFVLRNTKDQGETLFRSLASYTDCMSVHFNSTLRYDDVLQCMKKQPFENIIAASEKFNGKGANSFFPVMGEEFIPMNPKDSLLLKRFSNVDLLVTTTKSEGAYFLQHFLSPYTNVADADKINPGEIVFYLRVFLSALLGGKPTASLNELAQNTEPETREEKVQFLKNISAVIGDYPYLCATTDFGVEYANLRHNVYHMQYDHRPWFLLHPTWFPSTHGDDIMFWLGSVYKLKERTRADERVADELMAILTAFAGKGTPQTRGKLTWPRINQGGYYMKVGSEVTELLRTPAANCRQWSRHYPQY